MNIIETPLKDCYLIEVPFVEDNRGFFMEVFNQQKLNKELDIQFEIKQVNVSNSFKNVLRGLHYQDPPCAQTKLVGVMQGAVHDVVVDLRKDSPTYMKHYKATLDQPNKFMLVPYGFAHGYNTLEDNTLFYYFVDAFYSPEHEKGIRYNDNDLNIDWGFLAEPIVSERDLKQPLLSMTQINF